MQPGDLRAAPRKLAVRAGTGSHHPQVARRHALPESCHRIRYAHRQSDNGGARSMHDWTSATKRPLLRLGDTARFAATITDWSAGERLSVWGWRPGVSKVQWVDSAGAPGWTGVTMHGDLNGNGVIDTSVTWTGLTRSQLPTPLEFDGLLWFT